MSFNLLTLSQAFYVSLRGRLPAEATCTGEWACRSYLLGLGARIDGGDTASMFTFEECPFFFFFTLIILSLRSLVYRNFQLLYFLTKTSCTSCRNVIRAATRFPTFLLILLIFRCSPYTALAPKSFHIINSSGITRMMSTSASKS